MSRVDDIRSVNAPFVNWLEDNGFRYFKILQVWKSKKHPHTSIEVTGGSAFISFRYIVDSPASLEKLLKEVEV